MNKVLVIGRNGQLAKALARSVPENVTADFCGSNEFDLRDLKNIAPFVHASAAETIINASAWTAVDLAESESEAAHLLNEKAVSELAKACHESGKHLLHVSTDFVFDGAKNTPYRVSDSPNPLGVYGRSKLAGELAVQRLCPSAAIVRTSWVYGADGNNFLLTMLRLMAERDELGVVADQIGSPTRADDLANVLWQLAEKKVAGLWHFTSSGVASWYDFAVSIEELGRHYGLLKQSTTVRPITTADYPTPAKRPHFSVLDLTETQRLLDSLIPHWRAALESEISSIAKHAREPVT